MENIQNKKLSGAQKRFIEYNEYINNLVVSKYGSSYEMPETIGDTWRAKYKYSPDIEKQLIKWTIVFVILHCDYVAEESNLRSLDNLIENMSAYLAEYTSKNPKNDRSTKKQLMVQLSVIKRCILYKGAKQKIRTK